MKIRKFVKNNLALCIGTFGLAIIGYMGYRAIRKCCRSGKVDKVSQDWWKKVAANPDFIQLNKNWKALAKKDVQEIEATKIKNAYEDRSFICRHPPLGNIYNVPGNFNLWMPGVAIVAAHLAKKKNVEGLLVCQSLETLADKIEEIGKNPADQKVALIVGTNSSGPHNPHTNFPQHKVTVCVEKKEGKLTIALLDTQPMEGNKEIDPSKATEEIWSGYRKNPQFNCQELVYRAIYKGLREAQTEARLLHSQVHVQNSFGCVAFALKNGISFLRRSDFFDQISVDSSHPIEVIKQLPPEFMRGAQSTQILNRYKMEGGRFDQPFPGTKKTLQMSLDKHLILGSNQKLQNHYITKKSFKYLKFAAIALDKFKAKEIEAIVSKTLLK